MRVMRVLCWFAVQGLSVVLMGGVIANYNAARERPSTRSCPMNLTNISRAIEMYDLDKNTKIVSSVLRSPGPCCVPIPADLFERLIAGQYLSAVPVDPGFEKNVYCLTSWSRGVFCLAHGDVLASPRSRSTARQQLVEHGITDPALLASALDTYPPGYEPGLSPGSARALMLATLALTAVATSSLVRR